MSPRSYTTPWDTILEYVKTFDCKDPRKIPDPKYISGDYVYAPSTNRNGQFIFDGRCFAVNHERKIRISGSYGAGACISAKWGYYEGDGVQFVFPIWPLFETIIVETEDGRGRFVEGWPIALFVPITILEREYERAFYETNSIYLALPDFRVLRRDIIDGLTEFGTRGGVALAWLKSFRVVLPKRRPTPKEWLALRKHVRDERLRLRNAEKATIG